MPAADLPGHAALSYSQQYRRCGKPGCTVCLPGAPGHGPYWYAYWHENGRLRSRYVGRQAPDGAIGIATSPPTMALRVRTLGGFQVWRGDAPIAPRVWRRRKAADLFKLLLGAPSLRLPRDEIVEALWPEADPDNAAAALRAATYQLRRVLSAAPNVRGGAPWHLRAGGDMLVLDPAAGAPLQPDWLDAETFARTAETALAGRDAALCHAALELYTGEYLPDDREADWTWPRRESLRDQYLALLSHLAAVSAERGNVGEAEARLRELLVADPCREAEAQQLMALLAATGRDGDALHVYEALARALNDTLGIGPVSETAALRDRLVTQASALPAASRPAADAAVPRATNLPALLSSFVGREREQAVVRDLLTRTCLVTLTGVGGCGKTRLALRVAECLTPCYPDGVWLVELAALPAGDDADPLPVARAVAAVLGVMEEADRPLILTLADALRARTLLLVLDNCEHLIASCAAFASALLAECASPRILATSREPLGCDGEGVCVVPPLTLPPRTHTDAHGLMHYEAVALFEQRARLVCPSFALTDANGAAVTRICRRLDGIPLAIELAAARLDAMTVGTLAARLDDSLHVLSRGSRGALPRQQTLRAAMEWSYALLNEQERMLLRRLAVFVGGCTEEAAIAVCADGHLSAEVVPILLAALARKSLVTPAPLEGAPRYGLLETVRQYARERLDLSGEYPAVAWRHCAWLLSLAEEAEPQRAGPEQGRWLARLESEHDNLRGALTWAVAQAAHADAAAAEASDRPAAVALRLVNAWRWFWDVRGHLSEGRRWMDRALDVAPAPSALRARALTGAGLLAERQGDLDRAAALYAESLAIWRAHDDKRGVANALIGLGVVVACQGDLARAMALLTESLELDRALGYKQGMTISLNNLGGVAAMRQDYERAAALYEESLALSRELGDTRTIAMTLNNLGDLALYDGAFERAAAVLAESLEAYRLLLDRSGIALTLHSLGGVARRRGDWAGALSFYRQSLVLRYELGEKQGIAETLEGMAAVYVEMAAAERAAYALGAAERLRKEIGAPLPPINQPVHAACAAAIRTALGDALAEAAWARGRSSTPAAILALLAGEAEPASA